MVNIRIANRLVELRKFNNLSREDVVSRQAISKCKRAEASPDIDKLFMLANLYGVNVNNLLNTDSNINIIKNDEIKISNEEIRKNKVKIINKIFFVLILLMIIRFIVIDNIIHYLMDRYNYDKISAKYVNIEYYKNIIESVFDINFWSIQMLFILYFILWFVKLIINIIIGTNIKTEVMFLLDVVIFLLPIIIQRSTGLLDYICRIDYRSDRPVYQNYMSRTFIISFVIPCCYAVKSIIINRKINIYSIVGIILFIYVIYSSYTFKRYEHAVDYLMLLFEKFVIIFFEVAIKFLIYGILIYSFIKTMIDLKPEFNKLDIMFIPLFIIGQYYLKELLYRKPIIFNGQISFIIIIFLIFVILTIFKKCNIKVKFYLIFGLLLTIMREFIIFIKDLFGYFINNSKNNFLYYTHSDINIIIIILIVFVIMIINRLSHNKKTT